MWIDFIFKSFKLVLEDLYQRPFTFAFFSVLFDFVLCGFLDLSKFLFFVSRDWIVITPMATTLSAVSLRRRVPGPIITSLIERWCCSILTFRNLYTRIFIANATALIAITTLSFTMTVTTFWEPTRISYFFIIVRFIFFSKNVLFGVLLDYFKIRVKRLHLSFQLHVLGERFFYYWSTVLNFRF